MLGGGIDYLIHPGQRKTILWTNIIKIVVVNVDLPLPPFLWNYHYIRQPIQIFDFSYKFGYQ